MNRLGMLLAISMNLVFAMDTGSVLQRTHAYSPRIKRSHSDSDLLPQKERLSSDDENDQLDTPSSCYLSAESQDSNEEDSQDEELAQLARLTHSPLMDPLATVRGTRVKVKVLKHTLKTNEATIDDFVRIVQFNSRAALAEARMLNKTIGEQLDSRATQMNNKIDASVQLASASLAALNNRLQQTESLVPLVSNMVKREQLISEKYNETCSNLEEAFEEYATNVKEKELDAIVLLEQLTKQHSELAGKLNDLDIRTKTINVTTREIHTTLRLQIWRDTVVSACAIITSMGVLTFILSHFIGGQRL